MKRSVFILSAMLIALVAVCQTIYYKGEWSSTGTTYNYSGFLKLTIKGSDVTGEVIWKLLTPDKLNQEDYDFLKDKVGSSAVEIIVGTYNPETKDLYIRGIDEIDPNEIIDTDVYTLKVSSNGIYIFGKTNTGGADNGVLYATRQKAATAAIEYAALRKKIK